MRADEFMTIDKESNGCPGATQNIAVNTKNRDATIKGYNYGPLNVDIPGDYFEKVAEFWNTSEEAAKESLCGNCVAFDISDRMDQCMPGRTSAEADEEITQGVLGFCWMHHFKCHSERTCHSWAKGGPITDDAISKDWATRHAEHV